MAQQGHAPGKDDGRRGKDTGHGRATATGELEANAGQGAEAAGENKFARVGRGQDATVMEMGGRRAWAGRSSGHGAWDQNQGAQEMSRGAGRMEGHRESELEERLGEAPERGDRAREPRADGRAATEELCAQEADVGETSCAQRGGIGGRAAERHGGRAQGASFARASEELQAQDVAVRRAMEGLGQVAAMRASCARPESLSTARCELGGGTAGAGGSSAGGLGQRSSR